MPSFNGFGHGSLRNGFNRAPSARRRFSLMQILIGVVILLYTPWIVLVIVSIRHHSSTSSNPDMDNSPLSAALIIGKTNHQQQPRHQSPIKSVQNQMGNTLVKDSNKGKEKKDGVTDKFSSEPITRLSGFNFDRSFAEKQTATSNNNNLYFKPLMAYVEQPMNDTVPGTGYHGELEQKKKANEGTPPEFIVPLPRRLTTPSSLHSFQYSKVQSCHDLPKHLPIDRGFGNFIGSNVWTQEPMKDPLGEAPYCPVDADPFLPWIHDVFPSTDGSAIHFVAQNKRRCNTGAKFIDDLDRLQPQVALMQGVSVKRIDQEEAGRIAPDLWKDDGVVEVAKDLPRYKLAPFEESDEDGQLTRFLCRFHTTEYTQNSKLPRTLVLGETLSTYPFNYELVHKRKGYSEMITPRGKNNQFFWLSNLRFDCPVPDNGNLRQIIGSGDGVLSDGTATVYVDVVPIRTSPRFGVGEMYTNVDISGKHLYLGAPFKGWNEGGFNPKERWGDSHVLPLVEASGRWANIPLCKPPSLPPLKSVNSEVESVKDSAKDASEEKLVDNDSNVEKGEKQHTLAACLWASASFETRGNARTVKDTGDRLVEWVEFHLLSGFDHVYVYDNTGAHTNETSLESALYPRFSTSEVTRIDWPSRVCNNNIPAHENTGERSSQYAAESSCRQRYGQYTEWIASFDTDEYLIPMGDYTSMKDVVRDAEKKGTYILDFRSTRAYPSFDFTEPYYDGKECGPEGDPWCRQKRSDSLFLEAYNCDFIPLPKPSWADRARKQLYKPDYVLSHYVHYSTVTKGVAQTYKETTDAGLTWKTIYRDEAPIERPTDEVNEAVMIHTKTTVPGDTTKWFERCKVDFVPKHNMRCRVGFPYPDNKVVEGAANEDGYGYNCYTNNKVTDYWLPRLHDAIKKRNARLA